jgi:hypothetical protein
VLTVLPTISPRLADTEDDHSPLRDQTSTPLNRVHLAVRDLAVKMLLGLAHPDIPTSRGHQHSVRISPETSCYFHMR